MSRKNVLIIYTGGTFGMRPSGNGYIPSQDLQGLIRDRLPELGHESMPDFEIIEYAQPLESSYAIPRDWYELARLLHEHRHYDGFVVIHGTDTLAFTASALSFLLGDFRKPVLLTGSQIPLCEVRTDAQGNLLSAMQAIVADRLSEVAVCFGRHIFRGNRTTKVNATELDAFDSPNAPPLAEIGTEIRFGEVNGIPIGNEVLGSAPPLHRDSNVSVLRIYPGMPASLIDAVVATGAEGVVLGCYGVGTGPTSDPEILAALTRAKDTGVIVVAVSQCPEGSVALRRYAAGSKLADAGVLSGYDMTTEAAFTKLHALFALDLDRKAIEALMQQSLRGELTPK